MKSHVELEKFHTHRLLWHIILRGDRRDPDLPHVSRSVTHLPPPNPSNPIIKLTGSGKLNIYHVPRSKLTDSHVSGEGTLDLLEYEELVNADRQDDL